MLLLTYWFILDSIVHFVLGLIFRLLCKKVVFFADVVVVAVVHLLTVLLHLVMMVRLCCGSNPYRQLLHVDLTNHGNVPMLHNGLCSSCTHVRYAHRHMYHPIFEGLVHP